MSERKYWIASEEIAAGRWPADVLSDAKPEQILISYFNPETRAQVDGAFRFYEIQGKPTPKLELFEDSWLGLHELGSEFTSMMASLDHRKLGRVATPSDIVDGLKSVGFIAASQND